MIIPVHRHCLEVIALIGAYSGRPFPKGQFRSGSSSILPVKD
jgi:hypothetical protein